MRYGRICVRMILTVLLGAGVLAGCSTQKQAAQGGAVPVKAMRVVQQDTPLAYEYAGQVKGKDEVKVQPRVSGTVTEKYVKGGEYVQAGQALYKIDSRQYESSVLSAQAALAQSEATLGNAQTDLQRDLRLAEDGAIAEQTVTTQKSNVAAYQAAANANEALLQKAQESLDDTLVTASIAGRLDVNDVAVGTYASAGSTTLVTLGAVDPVYVQFSISETEYLKYMKLQALNAGSMGDMQVRLTLSDGQAYPVTGRLVQADRSMADNTGTLAVKAMFDNPDGILLPGMFARVRIEGETVPQALLVPQRAVQQLLDKTFVIVQGADGKSESKAVALGEKVGSYYIVSSGLSADDIVVVEGLTKLQAGMDMQVTMVTPEDMGFSLVTDMTGDAGKASPES